MKPPPFNYYDPETVSETISLLAESSNAKLLAGGQSLMPMMAMRYVLPDAIIDLNRVAGLDRINDEGDVLRIGSMVRQRDIEAHTLIRRRLPLMAEALTFVGHRQTRNRGTIGGSLCHLDPSAELPSVAISLDAIIEVTGPKGERQIPMTEFHAFYMTPAIEPDELVTAITVRPWSETHGSAFVEFARRHGDFAVASVAALVDFDDDDRIARLSLTVSGLSYAPTRVSEAEEALVGSPATSEKLDEAATVCGAVEAMGDVYASAAYRQRLAKGLAGRALRQACARARRPSARSLS